ncbi:MAG: hypothetical protein H6550_11020 [Chitinophagales bacterium]|nr:hypothetical protein [Chitinophagales bacterium]
MTENTLEREMIGAVAKLLNMAREHTWNRISDNTRFILSEIHDSEQNLFEATRLKQKENNKKDTASLKEILPQLLEMFDNLYDINLEIYKTTKHYTIIDIRCYLKSSLDEKYRKSVAEKTPMLHCKIPYPPWLWDKKEKFDINWQHKTYLNQWKMLIARFKLKVESSRR